MKECEAGCKVFDGGERRHHKDCFFYSDSLSEMYDKLEKLNTEMLNTLRQSRACLMSWTTDDGLNPQDKQFQKMIGELTDIIEKANK